LANSNHTWDPILHERWFAGDLQALFAVTDAHDCVEDWPFLAAYRELMDRYGASARYVLTLRTRPEIWLDSVIAHARHIPAHHAVHRRMAFGYDDPERYRAEYLAYYDRHNRGVRAAIAERGLEPCFAGLCWERGDGWAELCRLIGGTPPDWPFPHRNQRPTSGAAPASP
jgi:Sulfotransferase domain